MENSDNKTLRSIINNTAVEHINFDIELLATIFDTEYVVIALFDAQQAILKTLSKAQTSIDEIQFILSKYHNNNNSIIISKFLSTENNFDFPAQYQNLLSYIGVSIKNTNNETIGILYVLSKHFDINETQTNVLQLIADKISACIHSSIKNHKNFRKIIHDIKNPLTSISLQAELISKLSVENNQTKLLADKILDSIKKLNDYLNKQ